VNNLFAETEIPRVVTEILPGNRRRCDHHDHSSQL